MDPEVQRVINYLSSKEYREKRDKAILVFNERNIECDLNGHLNPEIKDNSCSYCYRRLKYYTPRDDAIADSRKNLSIWEQPCDLPARMEGRQSEIAIQKIDDYSRGSKELSKKLEKLGI